MQIYIQTSIRKRKGCTAIIDGDYNIYSLDMFDDSDELAAYKQLYSRTYNENI